MTEAEPSYDPSAQHPTCAKCQLFSTAHCGFHVDGAYYQNNELVVGLPTHDVPGGWVAIVIESPDEETDRSGDILQSSGIRSVLSVVKQAAPWMLERVWITWSVGCRTQGANAGSAKNAGKASDKQIDMCSTFLHHRIGLLRPAAIIPLGAGACRTIVGRRDVLQLTGRAYQMRVPLPGTNAGLQPCRVVHCREEEYDVYIGRDMPQYNLKDCGWGNPFPIPRDLDYDEDIAAREASILRYGGYVETSTVLTGRLSELHGRRLGCWCKKKDDPRPCHGDWLAKQVNDMFAAALEPVPEILDVPVYPLWAIGYAKDAGFQWTRYLELWKATISKIDGKNRPLTTIEREDGHIKFDLATTVADVERWFTPVLDHLDKPLAWDTEATGLKPWRRDFRIFLFSFQHPTQPQPLLIPVDYDQMPEVFHEKHAPSRAARHQMLELVRLIIENSRIMKMAHNAKFDQNAVRACYGWKLQGFYTDTQILEYCIDTNTQGFRGLDDLVRKYMPSMGEYWREVEDWKKAHPDRNYSQFPKEIMLPYAACDTAVLDALHKTMMRKLEEMAAHRCGGWFVRATEDKAQRNTPTFSILEYAMFGRRVHHMVTCEIEQNGLKPDKELIGRLDAHYTVVEGEVREALELDPQVKDFEEHHLIDAMAKTAKADWMKSVYYGQKRDDGTFEGGLVPDAKPRTPLAKVKEKVLASNRHPHINWNSIPQQKSFFIDYLKLEPVGQTDAGQPSLDADALQTWSLQGSVPAQLLLEYREFSKFLTSYIKPLKATDDDRIIHDDVLLHAHFNITGPRTGRLSTNEPNVQALPRDGLVKRLYCSRFHNGWIVQRDYSGLEVRVLALMCRDPSLIEAFVQGGDPHFRTQQYFFRDRADKSNKTQRSICKQALFGRIYGQGDHGLYALLRKNRVINPDTNELLTLEECADFNQKIDELYPSVPAWVELVHQHGLKHHWVCSAFGFCAQLPALAFAGKARKNNDRRLSGEVAQALRQSQNYGIQGTASDITTFAAYRIVQIMRKRKLKAILVLIVHDSIYIDCPEEEVYEVTAIMRDVMDNVPDWLPMLLPDFDVSWMDVPIIGELEVGINAKDALAACEEPSATDPNKRLLFKVPSFGKDDARQDAVGRLFGEVTKIDWQNGDHRVALQDWLSSQRFVFK